VHHQGKTEEDHIAGHVGHENVSEHEIAEGIHEARHKRQCHQQGWQGAMSTPRLRTMVPGRQRRMSSLGADTTVRSGTASCDPVAARTWFLLVPSQSTSRSLLRTWRNVPTSSRTVGSNATVRRCPCATRHPGTAWAPSAEGAAGDLLESPA